MILYKKEEVLLCTTIFVILLKSAVKTTMEASIPAAVKALEDREVFVDPQELLVQEAWQVLQDQVLEQQVQQERPPHAD